MSAIGMIYDCYDDIFTDEEMLNVRLSLYAMAESWDNTNEFPTYRMSEEDVRVVVLVYRGPPS